MLSCNHPIVVDAPIDALAVFLDIMLLIQESYGQLYGAHFPLVFYGKLDFKWKIHGSSCPEVRSLGVLAIFNVNVPH